jgi:hypothetical protein
MITLPSFPKWKLLLSFIELNLASVAKSRIHINLAFPNPTDVIIVAPILRGQKGRRVRDARLGVYIGRAMKAIGHLISRGGLDTSRTTGSRFDRSKPDLRLHRCNADIL